VPCGNASVYCPAGSVQPRFVRDGYYSAGGPDSGVASADEVVCGAGSFCVFGIQTYCPFGTFGSREGLSSAACSGRCSAGYECPVGSFSSTASPCPAGFFCSAGISNPCPKGTYSSNVCVPALLYTACRFPRDIDSAMESLMMRNPCNVHCVACC
jgi:hypothetical protein